MFFKPILLVFSVFISFLFVFGQNENEGEENKNLVPNPGFEVFSIMPHGWFYRGADFTSLVKDWSSASEASPDVYGPNITVPDTWQ